MMAHIEDIVAEVTNQINEYVRNEMELVNNAGRAGLDPRVGRFWINDECIITTNIRTMDYYGGFEWVEESDIVGEYKIYYGHDQRVRNHIDQYFDGESDVPSKVEE